MAAYMQCANCGSLKRESVPLISEIVGYCDGPGPFECEYVTYGHGCDYWRPMKEKGEREGDVEG